MVPPEKMAKAEEEKGLSRQHQTAKEKVDGMLTRLMSNLRSPNEAKMDHLEIISRAQNFETASPLVDEETEEPPEREEEENMRPPDEPEDYQTQSGKRTQKNTLTKNQRKNLKRRRRK